jgi:hypothetical protein
MESIRHEYLIMGFKTDDDESPAYKISVETLAAAKKAIIAAITTFAFFEFWKVKYLYNGINYDDECLKIFKNNRLWAIIYSSINEDDIIEAVMKTDLNSSEWKFRKEYKNSVILEKNIKTLQLLINKGLVL